ncbi:hypothetical protein BU23DRAFT_563622 [Bimuria novae-zelandiae CBS 107.79]|uniref:Uncharacterized protein n=1 Tax=Bimuria novae-zelandiae CBS 107.79 TaxID=1447943 RepID=A0A6A5VN67_9PLEO|nr:hypothetical protein BU23DRAFT_563622 [Bimuria novae-zelandiae CBS 107.79]
MLFPLFAFLVALALNVLAFSNSTAGVATTVESDLDGPVVTLPDLTPWAELRISPEDAAHFAASGTSPQDGLQIIETEIALFNGTPSYLVPGAYSAAKAMGLTMGTMADGGLSPRLFLTLGWRRQHAGITWKRDDTKTFDLADNFLHLMSRSVKWLLIRTLWMTFKVMTECDVNRYQLLKWGKKHEYCREFANVADNIEARIENYNGPQDKLGIYVQPHIRVKLRFNGITDEGRYDCKGTQGDLWDKIRSRMVPKFSAQVFDNNFVDFDVVCVAPGPDGECKEVPWKHDPCEVICREDPRWDNKDGSCSWHDKCGHVGHCDDNLNF